MTTLQRSRRRRPGGVRPLRAGGGLIVVVLLSGCASVPPPPPVLPVTFEQKMAWILRLEDQRMLRDPDPAPAVAPVVTARRVQTPGPQAPPPSAPDLLRLLTDPEARVRRRAALAIGRVGLSAGVAGLSTALAGDPEPEVRQMAAFGLGLIGDRASSQALRAALADEVLAVRGRAAQALGLVGEVEAAAAIGEMVAGIVATGAVAGVAPDDLTFPQDPAVETFRLGVYALARLKAYDALAGALLDAQGQPRLHWWPIAYAFAQTEDRRALPVLTTFARAGGYGASFAARGLGTLKDPAALPILVPLVQNPQTGAAVAVSGIRALAQIGDAQAIPSLVALASRPGFSHDLLLEAVSALATLGGGGALDLLLDLLSHRSPPIRAATLRALARASPDTFVIVLSGMDPDPHWSVRAALADALTSLEPGVAVARLQEMLADEDLRVRSAVLSALTRLRAPNIEAVLREHLTMADPVVRMSAAVHLGELNPTGAVPALEAAYEGGLGDSTYVARAAALASLAKAGAAGVEALRKGLTDKDWAVRVRAATLLADLVPGEDWATTIRPAPTGRGVAFYEAPALVSPAFSTHAYIETARGTIQIELAVLEAPLTVHNFVTLARKGFFDGVPLHRVVPNFVVQHGDPRGDGEGGPGFTIRDEPNQLPYLRGTVGMALDWADTGGSQFFITHSPQPHLDTTYTVFGRVIDGMAVVDQLQQWDVVERVRIWDGGQTTP